MVTGKRRRALFVIVPAGTVTAAACLLVLAVLGPTWTAVPGRSTERDGPSATRIRQGAGFFDNFTGSRLDRARWTTCYPWAKSSGCTNPTTGELEWYTPAGVTVAGGKLELIARRRTVVAGEHTYRYTSGMVTSARSFSFTYGHVDIQARMPAGPGLWSALWLLPVDQHWPPEIDLVEVMGADPAQAIVTYHPPHGPKQERQVTTANLSVGWHDFSLDWQPGSLTWFIDGHQCFHLSGSQVPHQPMYLLMDLAVSGNQPPNATTVFPAAFDIHHVRIQPG